jgi:DNA repair photolyase
MEEQTMVIKTVTVKNLLTPSKLPDADFVINPYIGCNHGCVYCYAGFMSRFTGHAGEKWGDFIDVKQCEKPLPQKTAGSSILIGSVTDPYNPLEKRHEKTRDILRQLQNTQAHLEILTKSPLVTRDIDILSRIKDVSVGISLSSTDEQFSRLTERHAASPERRLDAMRTLNDAGITVYAFISPIFPFLSDWKRVADEAGKYAAYTCFENLNLRGAYKRDVLNLIARHYPKQAEAFAGIYQNREQFTKYWRGVEKEIRSYMARKPYRLYFFHEKIKKQ